MDLSDPQERLEELERRLEADPSSRVFVQLAEEYRRQDRHPEAVKVLEAGLERQPDYLSAQVALGRCLLETGDAEGAVPLLEKVIARDQAHPLATRLLAEAHFETGRIEEAKRGLEVYRLMTDGDPEVDALRERIERAEGGEEPAPASEPTPPAGGGGGPAGDDEGEEDLLGLGAAPAPKRPGAEEDEDLLGVWDEEPAPAAEPVVAPPPPPPAEPAAAPEAADGDDEPFDDLLDDAAASRRGGPEDSDDLFDELGAGPEETDDPLGELFGETSEMPARSQEEPRSGPHGAPAEAGPAAPAAEATTPESGPAPAGDAEAGEAVQLGAPEQAPAAAPEQPVEEPAGAWEMPPPRDAEGEPVLPPREGREATVTLGRLYLQQGHREEAAEIFREVLDSSPDSEAARQELDRLEGEGVAAVEEAGEGADGESAANGAGLTDRKIRLLEDYLDRLRRAAESDVR